MFSSSPSKQEMQAQVNSNDFKRVYNNFSPINGPGLGAAANQHSNTQQDFNMGGRALE